ncbi:MAG: hypothetical protein C0425_08735 [Chlorobiaceae bacterium]|nr:hypothetical protein [Chlorobiaceae bacterium]MBA4310407.1 hypothetical protein [Chlorobiaceae bacterium]
MIVLYLVLMSTSSTQAVILYIDPGTGSLLFQIVSALFLALIFYLSLIKNTIIRFYGKIKKIFSPKVDIDK